MSKTVVKQGFVASDNECYSCLCIHPWAKGMSSQYTDRYVYRGDISFYTQEMKKWLGFYVRPCYVQKVQIAYFPRRSGFKLKVIGKPYKPKFST